MEKTTGEELRQYAIDASYQRPPIEGDLPQTWADALDIVMGELRTLMIHKHNDYGPDNILSLGVKGIFVRVWDKVNRLKRLVWEGREAQVAETVIDTWQDLSNYGIIAVMVERGWWELPFDED